MTKMIELTGQVGFASPIAENALSRRRILGIELIATLALAVSLIIAATAVSIGMARAQSLATVRTTRTVCYSPLTPAALMRGHHFSMSAFW
jgi:hypothetical protein